VTGARDGETFVWGHAKHTARALLDSAAALDGFEVYDVRTTINGFIVPTPVADHAADALQGDPPDDPETQF
jgi:hypothetical protein